MSKVVTARGWLGSQRVLLERCASTNDEAGARARAGAPHGTLVRAREQSAGRGRAGRQWWSPGGENLYLSVILRPTLAAAAVPPITLAAGLGVHEAVNFHGLAASLKWPNDVFCQGSKVAGILTEMSSRDGNVDYVVVGVGVNVNTRLFPRELAGTATSLRLALGDRPVDLERFADVLCAGLERWIDRFLSAGPGPVVAAWMERSDLPGRRVRVATAGGVVSGRAVGLALDGALRVEDDAGRTHRVVAGDVELCGRQ